MIKNVPRESIVDGRIGSPNGNPEAVQEICRQAAEQYRDLAITAQMSLDDIGMYLTTALDAVARGVRPDIAFQWSHPQGKKGRPKANNALRDWEIRKEVQAHIRDGQTWLAACESISQENGGDYFLSAKNIQTIAKGIVAESALPLPDDLYPLTKQPYMKKPRQTG